MIEPGRPTLPRSYGIRPPSQGRLLRWEDVEEKLVAARNYWIATASAKGVPHVAPVWGLWYRGGFFFGTDPQSRKAINIASNSSVVVHLESGDDVVIIQGFAQRMPAGELPEELDAAYFQKYGFHLKGNPTYRVEPQTAFACAEADYPESATRWQFPQDDRPAAV